MTRAMHEIQVDAMKIIGVNLPGAVDVCDWVAVHNYARQLEEIAQRGLYHASQERQKEISAFARGDAPSEREAR